MCTFPRISIVCSLIGLLSLVVRSILDLFPQTLPNLHWPRGITAKLIRSYREACLVFLNCLQMHKRTFSARPAILRTTWRTAVVRNRHNAVKHHKLKGTFTVDTKYQDFVEHLHKRTRCRHCGRT